MINYIDLEVDAPEYTLSVDDDVGESLDADMRVDVNHVDYVLPPATTETLGGIIVGDDLQITPEGVLSVIKATEVQADNTRPITSAAVFTEVGNINALLHTI